MSFGKKTEGVVLPPSDAAHGTQSTQSTQPTHGAPASQTTKEFFDPAARPPVAVPLSGTIPHQTPDLPPLKPDEPIASNDPRYKGPSVNNTDGVMYHPSPEQKALEEANARDATQNAASGKPAEPHLTPAEKTAADKAAAEKAAVEKLAAERAVEKADESKKPA